MAQLVGRETLDVRLQNLRNLRRHLREHLVRADGRHDAEADVVGHVLKGLDLDAFGLFRLTDGRGRGGAGWGWHERVGAHQGAGPTRGARRLA